MFITKEKNEFLLSAQAGEISYCRVMPPALVLEGKKVTAPTEVSGTNCQKSCISGLAIEDKIEPLDGGIFKIRRIVTNQNPAPVRFKSIFEVKTSFQPKHFVFPGFNYDTSHCQAPISAGKVLIGFSKAQVENTVQGTPTGLEKDGKPWVFAYDRTGIPSASVSEDETHVVALFASDENPDSLKSSGSIVKCEDGTFRHRIFHPVSEMPYTYAQKNSLEAPYETFLTLESGKSVALSMYLFVGEPKFLYYGTASLMEACSRVFPFHQKPALSPEEVRRVGVAFFRFLQKEVDGVPMFVEHYSDKLFSKMHSSQLRGEALAEAMKDPASREMYFAESCQIGWAGQGAMVARLFAANGFRTQNAADVEIAEKCLDGYVSTQTENGLLYPIFHQKRPEERRNRPDSCNMGWGMCELMRSYRLFRRYGKIKKNYYDFSVKLADFALRNYNDAYGFAKNWEIDGTPISTEGSAGGFMIMGLCEVHRETKDPRYLEAAIRAMDFYYTRDLDNFLCTAGALDCACVDKETAYPFFEAALYLYELTGEKLWLERAEKAAYYFFSWMFFYDCLYDADADFTKYGYHTTGGTLISAEHSAIDPWGALMVDGMFRLWHLTGNENYKLWAQMTWWNALLGIATEDTPEIHGRKRPVGSQNEGFFHCRWTKYRPTCEERGHFNDHLQSWMGAWRVYTLEQLSKEDIDVLWGKE